MTDFEIFINLIVVLVSIFGPIAIIILVFTIIYCILFYKQIGVKPEIFIIQNDDKSNIAFLILFTIFILLAFIITRVQILNHWEANECSPSTILFAEIFGYNSQKLMNKCIANNVSNNLNAFSDVQKEIEQLQTDVQNTNTKIQEIQTSNVAQMEAISKGSQTKQMNALAESLQDTMNNAKMALKKIVGALMLGSYVNKGTLKTAKNMDGNIQNFLQKISSA